MPTRILLITLLAASSIFAQAGDGKETNQPEVWKTMNVPPAPVVPPDKAIETFRIAPGFRIELVAAEPLVQDPVAITWDADGRLWVVEMRGYMPNVDGKGEDERIGRINILEDTDGDGKMDQSTIFLDGLQMPRAITLVQGGALVAEPPVLWYCRDTNGDLKCDEKIEVLKGYGAQGPVEHTENGLMRGLDNWLYNAKSSKRLKFTVGSAVRTLDAPNAGAKVRTADPVLTVDNNIARGQWGITQDNYGRLYHNSNSSYLHADLIPAQYLRRNPFFPINTGKNIAADQAVHSIRVNPGVNRGYQGGTLRPDGRLKNTTATCGPGVYRGDQFPLEFVGDLFIPEPSGNVVAHFHVEETDGNLKTIHRTYDDPQWKQREFLASTDERFRPVSAHTGPDGALYIVDLYRGILQHRVYVTTFLRKQILERGLDQHVHLGRIYRIVAETPRESWMKTRPRLSKATDEELIKTLAHPNGWRRDTAQRLLVERNDPADHAALRKVATGHADPLARIHALWTLEGVAGLDFDTLTQAVESSDVKVKTHAMRLSEPILNAKLADPAQEPELLALLEAVLGHAGDKRGEVRRQFAFTLAGVNRAEAANALRAIAFSDAGGPEMREAILSGLHRRELEFLQRLLADATWGKPDKGREALIRDLAVCVTTENNPARIQKLIDIAGGQKGDTVWRAKAILGGISAVAFPGGRAPKPLYYETQPKGMVELGRHEDKAVRDLAVKLGDFIRFGAPPPPAKPPTPLTAAQQKQYDAGKTLFAQTCASCHQASGLGEEGKAPPLIDSPYLLGVPSRAIRIVLQGVAGPITVHGRTYNMEMPPLKGFTDGQIAAILTYARREWEHTADPVEPETVTKVRQETKDREAAWSEKELLKVK
jgi:putative membrane-bound dehydrogenase-like protein